MKNDLTEHYTRTLRNCRFFEKEGNHKRLLNEIGVLRGILYCMYGIEDASLIPQDALYYINVQNELWSDKYALINISE